MISKIFIAIAFFSSVTSAKTVMMLGDTNTMNLKQYNMNLFDPFDVIQNFGVPARTIVQLKDSIVAPFTYFPDTVTVMIGTRDLMNGFANGALSIDNLMVNYDRLLTVLESKVPDTTTIMIFGIFPIDSTQYTDGFRRYLLNTIVQFNTRLEDLVWSREKGTYSFINAYDYMLTSDSRVNRMLFQNTFNQYSLLNFEGFNVLKQAVTDTLNYSETEQNTGIVHGPTISIRTNTYGKFHYTYFNVYVNGVLIGNYANIETMKKVFSYSGSGNIEIVMTTW
jgi:hypothetical protein